MKTNQLTNALAVLLLLAGVSSCKKEISKNEASTLKPAVKKAAGTGSAYWLKAQQTHNFVVGNLKTTYNSYRVNTTTQTTQAYEWYNISQIYADAAMVKAGDAAYLPYMNNTYTWMNNMWDFSSANGGYFAGANVNGTGAGGDKYTDDNALTGVAYLDAYAATTGTTQTNYLNSAIACANWLMNSGAVG
jgi:hypothetical protein